MDLFLNPYNNNRDFVLTCSFYKACNSSLPFYHL